MSLTHDLLQIASWLGSDITHKGESIVKRIHEAADALRWRKVAKELPPKRKSVLVKCANGNYLVWYFEDPSKTLEPENMGSLAILWLPIPPSKE